MLTNAGASQVRNLIVVYCHILKITKLLKLENLIFRIVESNMFCLTQTPDVLQDFMLTQKQQPLWLMITIEVVALIKLNSYD